MLVGITFYEHHSEHNITVGAELLSIIRWLNYISAVSTYVASARLYKLKCRFKYEVSITYKTYILLLSATHIDFVEVLIFKGEPGFYHYDCRMYMYLVPIHK